MDDLTEGEHCKTKHLTKLVFIEYYLFFYILVVDEYTLITKYENLTWNPVNVSGSIAHPIDSKFKAEKADSIIFTDLISIEKYEKKRYSFYKLFSFLY